LAFFFGKKDSTGPLSFFIPSHYPYTLVNPPIALFHLPTLKPPLFFKKKKVNLDVRTKIGEICFKFIISHSKYSNYYLFTVSHTNHDLVFIWNTTDPLVVNPEIELPQLDISNNYTADCTIEYSTGKLCMKSN